MMTKKIKNESMTLEEKEIDRFLFLQKLYEITEGNSSLVVREFGKQLGFEKEKIDNIENYLTNEGLIKPIGRGEISITHYGVTEIEKSISNPNSSTSYFPAINVIHIETMDNSAIEQGTSYSTQTNSFNIDKSEDLKKIISEIENIKDQITLDRLIFDELVSKLDTLKSQIKSSKPQSVMITDSLKTIKSILEGVAGNVATPVIIGMINSLIN
jgi:DNA primase large subunit